MWKGVVGVCWQIVYCSRLNPGARGEHLTIQRSWLATRPLVKHICSVDLVQRWGYSPQL